VNCLLLAGGLCACSVESKGDRPYLESANRENNRGRQEPREREREREAKERGTRAKQILAGSTSPTKCSDRGKATLSSIPVCLPGFTPLPSNPVHPRSYTADYLALLPRRFYALDTRVYLTRRCSHEHHPPRGIRECEANF